MSQTPLPEVKAPISTYRFQINADFDLFEATRRLGYLHELGVDWVYLSPLLQAEAGSDHGYDVVRHDRIDPARGGTEGLAALSAEAKRLGMGVLVDIVPNHVGVATPTPGTWWWDLLQHGRDSTYASYFDVDWDAGDDKVLIPVVGDDDLVDGGGIGHLEVRGEGVDARLAYHDNVYPIAPGSAHHGADPQAVHARQNYRLMSWREADDKLNYRRFFAVNTLAAIRVEDREVLDASHVEIRRWFAQGLVDGLRVDHPDGLREPGKYLDDLAELTGGAYVLVEKILEPGEQLPDSWRTDGTTGYDPLAWIDRVLSDPLGQEPLDDLESRLRGLGDDALDWADLVHGTKRDVADTILSSEVRRIVRDTGLLGGTLPDDDSGEPLQAETLVDAVAELVACFDVYRSYLPEGREDLDHAFADARDWRPDLGSAYDILELILSDPEHPAALRLQQTSGMVMAKGVEDCAFYRFSRLTSLNEVGGDPSEFALAVEDFHELAGHRQEHWPHAMTCLSTHDTKRGEDVRARITVLSEVPQVWVEAMQELQGLAPLPDPGFGSLLWQAILGCWPGEPHEDLRSRLHGYAEKAMREAGDHTTWTAPEEAYERAVHAAVDACFDNELVREVISEVLGHVVGPGWSNALAAKLVALTMPGVPDVYQGSELWEQSLVDPDNRRRVDYPQRFDLLRAVADGATMPLTDSAEDRGLAKLAACRAALRLKRDRPELFGSYSPVGAAGEAAEHVLAFDRGGAVTLATRLPVGLAERGGWGETVLSVAEGEWTDAITGRTVTASSRGLRVADVLAELPVALLVKHDG